MFELEQRRAAVERHRENAARLGQAFGKFESVGQGFILFEEALDFGMTFIEEPFISYGAQLDLDELAELQGLEPGAEPTIPMTTGVVVEWDRDDRDFYVGAWMGVRVHFPPEDAIAVNLDVVVNHHFTFTAVAIKDVPIDTRE